MKSTGIILAGGASSRMGEEKGLVEYDGKSMIEHILVALQGAVDHILIVASDERYGQFGYPVYSDLIPQKGPVGGIYTGLHYSSTELNMCLSCDVPLVTTEFIEWIMQVSSNGVTLPRCNGKTHQLMGVYRKSALSIFREAIDSDELKLSLVNEKAGCTIVDVEESSVDFDVRIFSNLNTKADINKGYNETGG